ncbi:MAG TPA: thiamine pyrophosphate-binding protein [Kofleriaceae bacterium]|nr:thiamine pyrophosphate-binding protein [Kofleriaceae bacterium]
MPLTQPRESSSPNAVRVLVVDDDGVQLRALHRAVRANPEIALTTVDNAIDAMLMIGSAKPDLVVIDVYMPGLDGLEACRRIRENAATADVEVIIASAAMTPELEAAALEAGARRAIGKPFAIGELIEEVIPAPAPPPPEPEVATLRGADVLVDMLEQAGVDVVFGLPGGAISPVHDALLDSKIRVVTTRHEAGAMFAAAGYAHGTGRLGVVAVTSGPGFLNAMTGLASAWCDGLPLLLLVGEVPRAAHGKGVLQDGSAHGLQIIEMARYVSKMAVEVPRPSGLPHLMRRAIATAMSGRKGPVVLTLPLDVTCAQLTPPRIEGAVTVGGMVDTETLDEIATLVLEAERPLMLVGSGTRGHGAPQRLVAVAERLGCPIATTPKAKGVFPEDHPLALGVLGMGGHRSAQRYLESGVDVVVAIGTSLGDMATAGFSPHLQASRALVHIDIDARQIGKSYSPTLAVVASAHELLGGLADRISERELAPRDHPRLEVERHRLPSSQKPGKIAASDAIDDIQALLPADTIYTVDSGEHFMFATHYLKITRPDSFLVMTGLGSMGQSIGAAVGAQLAHPDRTVAAICGDGCFAMNAFEIATAVAERLPIRVFVFNDERLGMVENGHDTLYGRHPSFSTGQLDICSIARGLGAATAMIDKVGKLEAAEAALRSHRGPVVYDMRIDPTIALPNLRIAAIQAAKTQANQPARRTQPQLHVVRAKEAFN